MIDVADTQREQFKREGYFIPDFRLDEKQVEAVRMGFERLQAAAQQEQATRTFDASAAPDADKQGAGFVVRGNFFPVGVHRMGQEFLDFCRQPALVELCRQLIGRDADLCWNQAIIKPPKTGGHFSWHQDARYAVTEPLDPGFTCWVAITRTTVANGTLWVAPKWYRGELLPHEWDEEAKEWQTRFDGAKQPPDDEKFAVELEPGQMLIFKRLLPHASGPNTTDDQTRMAYQIAYTPPEIRLEGQPFGDQIPVLRGGKAV